MEIRAKVVRESDFKRAIRRGVVVGREGTRASFRVGVDLWFIADEEDGSGRTWHGRVPNFFQSGSAA